jgi:hypothetical protein
MKLFWCLLTVYLGYIITDLMVDKYQVNAIPKDLGQPLQPYLQVSGRDLHPCG